MHDIMILIEKGIGIMLAILSYKSALFDFFWQNISFINLHFMRRLNWCSMKIHQNQLKKYKCLLNDSSSPRMSKLKCNYVTAINFAAILLFYVTKKDKILDVFT